MKIKINKIYKINVISMIYDQPMSNFCFVSLSKKKCITNISIYKHIDDSFYIEYLTKEKRNTKRKETKKK